MALETNSHLMMIILSVLVCSLRMTVGAPYQELAPRPGHVPVYIRVGDTPLSEIHPKLAEAFGELDATMIKESEQSEDGESIKKEPVKREPPAGDIIITAHDMPTDVNADSVVEHQSAQNAGESLPMKVASQANKDTGGDGESEGNVQVPPQSSMVTSAGNTDKQPPSSASAAPAPSLSSTSSGSVIDDSMNDAGDGLETSSSPVPESDIASFDVVKG